MTLDYNVFCRVTISFSELPSKHNFIKTKNNKSTNFYHNVAIFDDNVASKHKPITMKQNIHISS
jgi:hypothetical protein